MTLIRQVNRSAVDLADVRFEAVIARQKVLAALMRRAQGGSEGAFSRPPQELRPWLSGPSAGRRPV